MEPKICQKCGKEFFKPHFESRRAWEKRRFCSLECRKQGEIRTCPTCGKIFYAKRAYIKKGWLNHCSISCAKKGKIPPNLKIAQTHSHIDSGPNHFTWKGKTRPPFSEEWKKNISKGHLAVSERYSGEHHWNWKGGITKENHKIRTSTAYQQWRMEVLKRDNFTCVECGYRSIKPRDIVVDHIKPFSAFPESRLDLGNGRTLCRPCDRKVGFNYERDRIADAR